MQVQQARGRSDRDRGNHRRGGGAAERHGRHEHVVGAVQVHDELALGIAAMRQQAARGTFVRHTLETGGRHVSVDAADYDRDGDVDLVLGQFGSASAEAVEVWENLGGRR